MSELPKCVIFKQNNYKINGGNWPSNLLYKIFSFVALFIRYNLLHILLHILMDKMKMDEN
jgi:hypothetical protein